jgi:hypothetical protein
LFQARAAHILSITEEIAMNHSPPRPGSVITAAVLLFVYGTLMLACNLCSVGVVAANGGNNNNAVAQELPFDIYVQIVTMALSLLLAAGMIAAGVGTLRLMPIARIATYGLCVADIFISLLGSAYQAIFVFPVTEKIFAQAVQNQPQAPFDFAQLIKGSQWFGLCLGISIVLAFCIPIMIFLSTASARAAFKGEYHPEPPPRDRRDRFDDFDDDDDDYRSKSPPRFPGDTGIKGEE